jgi:hypothetical protein
VFDSWNGGYYDITDADSNIVTTGTGPPNEGYGVTPWYQYPFGINVAVAAFTGAEFDGVVLNDSETAAVLVTNGGYGAAAILAVEAEYEPEVVATESTAEIAAAP